MEENIVDFGGDLTFDGEPIIERFIPSDQSTNDLLLRLHLLLRARESMRDGVMYSLLGHRELLMNNLDEEINLLASVIGEKTNG